MPLRVGFIGLGAMGKPMASHLYKHGLLNTIWNRNPEVGNTFIAEHKVKMASSPDDLASNCNVVILCVSADDDVLNIIHTITPHLPANALVIDHSSVAPATAERAANILAQRQIQFLDAPVSGGVEGARLGKLSIMVGGDQPSLQQVTPIMNTYAARITHMGKVGNGQATKAVNQVLVAGIAEAVCEGLALAERLELPSADLLQVLTAGAAGSWFLDKRGASMLNNDCDDGFKLELLLKDLGILQQLSNEHNLSLAGIERASADYQKCLAAGDGNQDISALIRLKRTQIIKQ